RYYLDAGEHSGVSLKVISEQFNIPYQTVRRHAAAHEWSDKRYKAWIEKKYGMSYEEYWTQLKKDLLMID
ncbi:hypothetical protein V7101_21060, partial [Bacillus velezensis]|uniref:hypothetical protein n=1 Tax=Bacillus velezensis TaxID=492670 RepID=UPI002FFE23AA